MSFGQNKARRAGFTLTELAVVLGMVGVIISAIWWASSNVRETQKDSDASVEVQTVSQNISMLFEGQKIPGAVGDITGAMITAQAIPSLYVDATNNATADNPWAPQNFFVYKVSNTQFRISVANITLRGCLQMLLQDTSCHFGQVGCPVKVATACSAAGVCGANSPLIGGVGVADWWTFMNTKLAAKVCGDNAYPGWGAAPDTVDFYYNL